MWRLAKRLKAEGVLGINRRNSAYAIRYNPRNRYPLVDDKLKTKALAIDANIPVPRLYAHIKNEHQLKSLDALLLPYPDFVIKPAHGAGGDGILVVTNRVFGRYRLINGEILTTDDLSYHLSCLLSGAYSLSGHPDEALIERRVVVDSAFESISHEGVPDVRVITLLGYPAMAMLRLPTRVSNGKANLHQGAIGVGVNIATGLTLGGVLHNETIDYHPDTLNSTVGIQVPFWDDILRIAASAYELTGLGYLGVDIVLDKTEGPLMLELNARPGLNIQIANRQGLLTSYEAIEAKVAACGLGASVDARVAFSQALHADSAGQQIQSSSMLERADALYLEG
ncbi:MAG: alpha-L-glutamate ligase-like protein [Gammaproteobacteria bacterium]|nr:alpha-L-glutamate ligase-like protein [Gammaproteobacteria bacterium]MCH9717214.1 alpha-L-glutamate ligase-like protein [Gammaproteobacteria bacterium]MCH9762971.1 alpha-L-glutamate ligase-like protein [Gammaproteobacteria bacterium]